MFFVQEGFLRCVPRLQVECHIFISQTSVQAAKRDIGSLITTIPASLRSYICTETPLGQIQHLGFSQTYNIRKLRNCAEEMWKEQEGRFKKWKDEISCLLLFAGLLTTILTGFIVTYYVVRQSQTSTTASTDVLWFMSLTFTLAAAAIGMLVRQ